MLLCTQSISKGRWNGMTMNVIVPGIHATNFLVEKQIVNDSWSRKNAETIPGQDVYNLQVKIWP